MNVATERITRKFIGCVEDEWQLYRYGYSAIAARTTLTTDHR